MNCATAQDFMKFFHDAAADWIEPFICRRTPNAER
jgi:hypothetical protein